MINKNMNVDKIIEALDDAIQCGDSNQELLPWELEVLKNLEEQLPKFIENYNVMLKYLKDKSIPDTMCEMHQAIQNEMEAKEAIKILQEIGEYNDR